MLIRKKSIDSNIVKRSIFDGISDPSRFADVFAEEFEKNFVVGEKNSARTDVLYLEALNEQIEQYIYNDHNKEALTGPVKTELLIILLNAFSTAAFSMQYSHFDGTYDDATCRDRAFKLVITLMSNIYQTTEPLLFAIENFSFSVMNNAITLDSKYVLGNILSVCPENTFSDISEHLFRNYTEGGLCFSELELLRFLYLSQHKQQVLVTQAISELEKDFVLKHYLVFDKVLNIIQMCEIGFTDTMAYAANMCRLLSCIHGQLNELCANITEVDTLHARDSIFRLVEGLGTRTFGHDAYIKVKTQLESLDLIHDSNSWFKFKLANTAQIDNVKLPDIL